MTRWQTTLANFSYGLFASTFFHARSSPRAMRRRFELFATVPRERLQRRFPRLRFADHWIDGLHAEAVATIEAPWRVIVHLHGGAYLFGSSAAYRDRAMRIAAAPRCSCPTTGSRRSIRSRRRSRKRCVPGAT